MTIEREHLEQHRDQALRDLVDLDRQAADGEIPEQVAQRLRTRYEIAAADALEALEILHRQDGPRDRRRRGRRGSTLARRATYAAAGLVALLAMGVLLPASLSERPDGGFVSGNEVNQSAPDSKDSAAPQRSQRDLSTVTNEQMEAVISRNPGVVGMRLALAERYLREGSYDKAAKHYGVAIKQQPNNPAVLAGAGRLLLAQGKPRLATTYADRALATDPSSAAGWLLRAEVLAAKPGGAQAARPILDDLATRADLDSDLRRRVAALRRSLDQQRPEGGS